MLVTFDVSILLKLISSREVHRRNKKSIFSTDDESKCEKSIDIILLALGSLLSSEAKKLSKEEIGSEKYISIAVFDSIVN